MNAKILARAGLLLGLALPLSALAADAPPPAPVRPVVDTYHGVEVVDNYRYLEQLEDPEVQAWMRAQADFTRQTLDRLPGRADLLERIHALSNSDTRRDKFVRRGERYFYQVTQPGAQQPKLYYRDGLQGEEHLLLDPATLGEGQTTPHALDYFAPSWDGRYIAYGISKGGSEASVLHVMEVAGRRVLAEAIDRTDSNVISWLPDNRSFFYLRYPKVTPATPPTEIMFNARTYLHTLDQRPNGEGDPLVFGRGVARNVNVPEGQATYVVVAPGSSYAIAVANHNMDNNPATLFVAPLAQVKGAQTPWRKLADVADGVTGFAQRGDTLYFTSIKDAPRARLLALSLRQPDPRRARVVVAESGAVITDFSLAREGLYVRLRDGAVSKLLRVGYDHQTQGEVPLPFAGNVAVPVTDARAAGALFGLQGWVRPPQVFAYDPARNVSENTGLIPPSKLDVTGLAAEEVLVTGHDGTRIPLSILYRKDTVRDGRRPTILSAYGAYGLALEPRFSANSLAWLERGGVLAVAHVRGGGEYGEEWHRGGQKLTKLNTVFDFIACAQYLVDRGFTSPRQLAGTGGSAGGITVGGAMNWRPDLFAAILDLVGVSDALRFETEPNGPPNVPEFGSTKTLDGFRGLYAMSPYAHVRDGTPYPAVMFLTGANDPRVAPWHSTKMTARVQAASSSGRPVLLRIDYEAGHGSGLNRSQYERDFADLWSFVLWQMGDPAFQPKAAP
jgi:prolyl oligopeptidase